MKNDISTVLLVVVSILMVSNTAFAHHSQAGNYDPRETALTGTVTKFLLINPHSQIHFQVKDANGTVAEWMAQGGSPGGMRRDGWTSRTVKPGDQITITGNVARNGSKQMHIVKIEVSGKLIRNTEEEAGKVSPRTPSE